MPQVPSKSPSQSLHCLTGTIERITYKDPTSGFTIAKLGEVGGTTVSLVGTLPDLYAGQTVRCEGEWKQNPVHGREFSVTHCTSRLPTEIQSMQKYLQSGVIRGVGAKYAELILKRFGDQTFAILDKAPERLLEIPKFGPKRLAQVIECWNGQKRLRDVMIFLQQHRISPGFAKKIYRTWGDRAVEKLRSDPYALAREIFGIGFKTADEIAKNLGIHSTDSKRLIAGVECILSELTSEGHTCYPLRPFLQRASEILQVSEALLQPQLPQLIEQERIVIAPQPLEGSCEPFIWTKALATCERGIARELARIGRFPSSIRRFDRDRAATWAQEQLHLQLEINQLSAVKSAFSSKIHIITGGPGTGKSTITKIIVRLAIELKARVLLAAPTGRAAKRLGQVNDAKASTLHQLLEYEFGKNAFKRKKENPLEVDLLIIDESSMIDTWLFYSVLKALPSQATLLLIGDIDQLPSVGPGNILRDLIQSRTVSISKLDHIFRQAKESKIIQAAHAINRGVSPKEIAESRQDFFLFPSEDPAKIAEMIVGLVVKRLPTKLGLDPYRDIQVLAAMKRGVIGLSHLNFVLQEQFHPLQEPTIVGGRRFFVGDKVMQLRNNYRKEVFNGDIGRIVQLHASDARLQVAFLDDRIVDYEFSELEELQHAYAVSVHKYQGSESPCIIMPIHLSHSILLHRNLLYTAVTRGKSLVILVGSPKALDFAVRNKGEMRRYTSLKEELLSTRIGKQL